MELIFSNKPSVLNKKLIKFFQLNLFNLNKASLVFKFDVAHPNDSGKFAKRNIKNFPVLIKDTKHIVGVDAIFSCLKGLVAKHNAKIINKSETDKLDDYWQQTLGKINVDESGTLQPDDDDEEDMNADLQHKIQEAFAERSKELESPAKFSRQKQQDNMTLSRDNNLEADSSNLKDVTPSQTIKNMSSGRVSQDDILMAKFFENQEESM